MTAFEGHESAEYKATVELADAILAQNPQDTGEGFGWWRVQADGDPIELFERLQASAAGRFLLPEGASLSIDDPSGYYEQTGLYATKEALQGATLQGYRTTFPYDQGTNHSVELSFVYSNGRTAGAQELISDAYSLHSDFVTFGRKVVVNDYIETGYEGHDRLFDSHASPEAVLAMLAIGRDIFDFRFI